MHGTLVTPTADCYEYTLVIFLRFGRIYDNMILHTAWQWWQWKKIPSRGRQPSAVLVQEASQHIHEISNCHWILQNEQKNPIINKVHAPTNVKGCTIYIQDLLNIVGCNEGGTDGWKDGTEGAGHTNTLWPNEPRVISQNLNTQQMPHILPSWSSYMGHLLWEFRSNMPCYDGTEVSHQKLIHLEAY